MERVDWKLLIMQAVMSIFTPTNVKHILDQLRQRDLKLSPSMLLMSEKFWLWTIFSTMSSASMRVSLTQVG